MRRVPAAFVTDKKEPGPKARLVATLRRIAVPKQVPAGTAPRRIVIIWSCCKAVLPRRHTLWCTH
jgi:hypothetical protein